MQYRFKLMMIGVGLLFLMLVAFLLTKSFAPKVSPEIVQQVEAIKLKKMPYQEDIPKFIEPKIIQYSFDNVRNPFVPFMTVDVATITSPRPDSGRKREPLEAYALDTLTMVGTIEQSGIFYALLRDQTGLLYRVSVGNYVGQNSGKIESISPKEILIHQWVPNGRGGWRELPAKIFLKTANNGVNSSNAAQGD